MTYQEISALVLEESNDIVYIADPDTYEMLYLNRAAREVLGNPVPEDWLKKPCHKVLQNQESPCAFCTNHQIKEQDFFNWTHYNQMLGRCFSIKDRLIHFNGKKLRLELAVDMTEKENAVAQLKKKLHTEETLVACIQTLNQNIDIKQAINQLLKLIGDYHCADRSYIFEIDFDEKVVSNTYEWCKEGIAPQIDKLQGVSFRLMQSWFEQFERTGEFYIDSLDKNAVKTLAEYEILEAQGIQSLMAAPLRWEGKIVGFLGVDNPSENTDAMTLMRSVASFIINDINKRKLMNQLTYLSYTDGLTELENRHKYMQMVNSFEQNPPDTLGIVFVDINGLKTANDTHGHQYGDYLIVHVADCLKRLFRGNIYRIGGDEFVVLCPDADQKEFEEQVHRLRMLAKSDEELCISIGVNWDGCNVDVSKQITHADELMYIDKQTYYGIQISEISNYHANLSKELIREISEGCFVVYLQPKIELKTGKITGAEALVRRRDVSGNLVPPARFIARYEAEGIIRHVDFFVLETVCKLLSSWRCETGIGIKIGVNLSRVTLMEHDIVEKLVNVCQRYQVDTKWIDIEVTESIGTMQQSELFHLIQELKGVGFSISLDDFGSEYSNLAILTSMDFNEIKLDKSLIDHLESNKRSRVVTEHAIKMCKDLNLDHSVAEGIETLEQRDLLEQYQCDIGQGYYFDRPLSIEHFTNKYIKGGVE